MHVECKMFANHITSGVMNLFGPDPLKEKYKEDVYTLLQQSYKYAGGLLSSGTENSDVITKLPMWTVAVKNGKVIAAILYKDRNGCKAIATGTDGSMAGKRTLSSLVCRDASRSYSEKSRSSLNLFLKVTPNARDYLIDPVQAAMISGKDIIPISGLDQNDWPAEESEIKSALLTLERYPFLKDYGYFRPLKGHMKFKIMLGTPNKEIQQSDK